MNSGWKAGEGRRGETLERETRPVRRETSRNTTRLSFFSPPICAAIGLPQAPLPLPLPTSIPIVPTSPPPKVAIAFRPHEAPAARRRCGSTTADVSMTRSVSEVVAAAETAQPSPANSRPQRQRLPSMPTFVAFPNTTPLRLRTRPSRTTSPIHHLGAFNTTSARIPSLSYDDNRYRDKE
ncbi:hypothetical protein GALMADRAFT_238547 [Galerina marginata CBS 339.88]|uniref:Uncharacterized protein n=1 Tax=Galerina marginata (strain CBS 339.88) TaxID=685588 RepID=A0A067TKP1_GALM3|nr:hypothetical protein GALMADRAFT_238547 [Galerina marginata CBS 339.88]